MPELRQGVERTYAEAVSDALVEALERDPGVFVFGIGVDDPKFIFGTTREAARQFGPERVFDTPVSENALTGLAIGASLTGMRPILVHARNDFMYYSLDQLANHAAKWRDMFNDRLRAPIVVRAIVGKGWGQGAQHSQSLQALFAHLPGFVVGLPASPEDAKGMLAAAVTAEDPVILIEHRRLHAVRGRVPPGRYETPIGKAALRRKGKDVTIAAASLSVEEALEAASRLSAKGVDAEVLDMRWAKPLDRTSLVRSVRRTGRLVAADTSWSSCGLAAELAAVVAEECPEALKAPVARVTPPDRSAPTTGPLEARYYPGPEGIVRAALRLCGRSGGGSQTGPGSRDGYIGPF